MKKIDFNLIPPYVSIVGSRSFAKYRGQPMKAKIEKFVNQLREGSIVCSGGADGADSWAEEAAKARGLDFVPFYPEEPKFQENGQFNFKYIPACFKRNTQIADWAATNGGIVVAFVDYESATDGTGDTLRKARGMDCPTLVFTYKANGSSLSVDMTGIDLYI